MNNNQYIAALKKALSGLDKSSQNDILQEIRSHAEESGDSLIERFGPPEELAKQYLEGEIVATPLGQKIWGVSKKVFVTIGITVVALIALASLLAWWWTGDGFDYADETAAELNSNTASWQSIDWTDDLTLSLNQTSTVFYWHDEMSVRSNCKGKEPLQIEGNTLRIHRAKCLVYLPKVATTIQSYQSELVLVRPQVSLDMDIKQSQLRVAENGEKYQLLIEATRTKIDDLASHADATIKLNIKSEESMISEYSY